MLKSYVKELATTYTTTRLVRVKSPAIAILSCILVAIVWLSYLASIRLDVRRVYKSICPVRGAVLSKVKGFASTEKLTDYDLLVDHPHLYRRLWDLSDLVYPVQGGEGQTGSFTILTNLLITPNQTLTTCPEQWSFSTECHRNDHCPEGYWEPGLSNGVYTGRCLNTTRTCEIKGWCPPAPLRVFPRSGIKPLFEDVANFTVFLKSTVEFPGCGEAHLTNVANRSWSYMASCYYNKVTDPLCTKFKIGDIVKWSNEDFDKVAINGGVFRIRIKWKCKLDIFYNPKECKPKYKFSRVDSIKDALRRGWNFVSTDYHIDGRRTHKRNFGLKIVVDLEGYGRKIDFYQFILTLGSTVGLFSVAPLICDFLLDIFNMFRKRQILKSSHHEYCDRYGDYETCVGDDEETQDLNHPDINNKEIIPMEET